VAIGLLANIQDRLNVKGRTPERMAKIISRMTDEVLLHQCIKAAAKTTGHSEMTDFPGGISQFMAAIGDELLGAKIEAKLRAMSVTIEESENELGDGRAFMSPTTFGYLLDAELLTNSDFSSGADVAMMALKRVADMPIQKTVRLPKEAKSTADVKSNPWLLGADYDVTAAHAKVITLFTKRDAIMIAEAIPVTSEYWWDQGTKSWILDTYIAFGAGINDPRQAAILSKVTA
jgi:hypothetical protein